MNILAYDLEKIPTLKCGSNRNIALNTYKAISVNADYNTTLEWFPSKWNHINDYISNVITDVSHLDYLWIYGYAFPGILESSFIDFINKNVKSIKCIVFDLQGEGASSNLYFKYFDEFRNSLNIKEYRTKVFWLLTNTSSYKDYDIYYRPNFEIEFPYLIGSVPIPNFDINPNRKYLFSFLNGQLREHREILLKKILNDSIKDLGLISCLNPKNSELPIIDLGGYDNEFLWTSGKEFFKNSYVNLVSESDSGVGTNGILITEKSVKPFIYQQLPLFLAKYGTVDYLRKYEFDMFDDIIDHSYDSEIYLHKRTDMILNELIKLSKINLTQFFIENESRFKRNYDIYLDIVKDSNTLPIDVQNWIFDI